MDRSCGSDHNFCGHRYAKVSVDEKTLSAFLRRLYPRDTAAHVAADLDVSVRTAENWLGGASVPRLPHFLRMVAVYGPSVIAAAFPTAPRWLDDAVRAEERRALEAQAEAIIARLEAIP